MQINKKESKQRIIIFGLGNFYQKRKKDLWTYNKLEIVALSDNNDELWEKEFDGVSVIAPNSIKELLFDKILIMSTYEKEIFSQLLLLGIEQSKILFWEQLRGEIYQGKREIYPGKNIRQACGKKLLIISHQLGYHGGAIASIYAAMAMQDRGYYVVLSVPDGNKQLIKETTDKGITVAVCLALPYIHDSEREWIAQFDFVIVNVLPMMYSAYACGCFKPTLWWIHEAEEFYENFLDKPQNKADDSKLDNLIIYAVSDIAKKNFNKLFVERISKTLCYGIPDYNVEKIILKENTAKVKFAIIGNICKGKAQDIFVEAVSQLNCKGQAEFWIIGNCPNDVYGMNIKEMVKNIPSIKMLGVLTREDLYNVFPQIDVVVCASKEETMSITITEGMMFGKACITTENTGIAEYMQDGENGFVVPVGNAEILRDRMEWLITHRKEMERMGKAARKTYEQYFTMELFGNRLEQALIEIQNKWKH